MFHLTPAQLGFYFAAPAAGYALGNFVSGRYSVQVGMDRMVLFGSFMTTLPMALALLADLTLPPDALIFFGAVGVMAVGNGMVLPNANAGMLSVRPHLAGTASGLGGALTIGGGAGLSAIAGALLGPGSGATPLIALMTLSAAGSIASILVVIRRRRALGL